MKSKRPMPGSEVQSRKDGAPRAEPERKPRAKPGAAQQDEDVVGKAYDSRLMRRLITYLYPYKWACFTSIVAILLKAGADVLGPYFTMVAVDLYLTPATQKSPADAAAGALRGAQGHPWMARWLSAYGSGGASGGAWKGITELTVIWMGALVMSYGLE